MAARTKSDLICNQTSHKSLVLHLKKRTAFMVSAIFLVGLSQLGGCTKKTDVKFSVKVRTNQGERIPNATIKIDGKPVGSSDPQGNWSQTLELVAGKKQRLEVSKQSDQNYFAPDFREFLVDSSEHQEISHEATLYFVPKPTKKTTRETSLPDISGAEIGDPQSLSKNIQTGGGDPSQLDNSEYDIPASQEDLAEKSPIESVTLVEKPSYKKNSSDEISSDAGNSPKNLKTAQAAEQSPPRKLPRDVIHDPSGMNSSKILPNLVPEIDDTKKLSLSPASPSIQTYPKVRRKNGGNSIFTIHVSSGNLPVSGVNVYVGREEKGDLKKGCETNKRGRCVLRFESRPKKPIKFIAKKSGYFTNSKTIRIKNKGSVRFDLKKGETIDIFAITRKYNFTQGLRGARVYIDNKSAGKTDRYGHFSYQYRGDHSKLLGVKIKSEGHLPEEFETDFVVSGPMSLTKYFMPKVLPPAKMTVLRVQPAGKIRESEIKAFDPILDAKIRRATRSLLFSSKAFREVSFASFNNGAKESGRSFGRILSEGWQATDLKSKIDAIIQPTIVMGNPPTLELSVVDSRGQTIAAAKEELESLSDQDSINRSVGSIVKKIADSFPFEGAIIKKYADTVDVNIGSNSGRNIRVGSRLDIYGMQSGKLGNKKSHKKIATLVVTRVGDSKSTGRIQGLIPRATVRRGDQVVMLRKRKIPKNITSSAFLRVLAKAKGFKYSAISQANIYYNDTWIGSTNNTGRIYINPSDYSGVGLLRVIKHGYSSYSRKIDLRSLRKKQIKLVRETAYIRINSQPIAATVRVNGRKVGKTPLSYPVPVPSGFVKVELLGVSGYKPFSEVMELEKGTLDLTGSRKVILEMDFRMVANRLIKRGKIAEAVKKLKEIPESHSDYLLGMHQLGEIYLTLLDRPAQAAEAFGVVTAKPAVKQFNDKRFIGSHIDEGIALFLTGNRLAPSDQGSAVAHYQKAVEVLTQVSPFLRFIPKEQYSRAVHNVAYYKALSQHKIWLQSSHRADLAATIKTWREYLEGSAKAVPLKVDQGHLVQNARAYFKQAKASLVSLR